ncbi:hypothetical protein AB0E88_33875 [Streptomyces sp. NPDC028635]|uniref:hypothetical protein n=1 Tax=Streptomyces sp. NPDC028635 TaxID=3154800 RepID=UPI003400D2DC
MPQENAGRTPVRAPALALLVGLVLTLLTHVVLCALHSHGDEEHTRAAVPIAATAPVQAAGAWVREAVDCGGGHDAGAPGHPGHGVLCCDPADRAGDVRVPGAASLLILMFTALTVRGPSAPPAPPSRARATGVPARRGPDVLRLVCVSRT